MVKRPVSRRRPSYTSAICGGTRTRSTRFPCQVTPVFNPPTIQRRTGASRGKLYGGLRRALIGTYPTAASALVELPASSALLGSCGHGSPPYIRIFGQGTGGHGR